MSAEQITLSDRQFDEYMHVFRTGQVRLEQLVARQVDAAENQKPTVSLRDMFAMEALSSISGTNPDIPGDKASLTVWPSPEELAMRRAVWAYLQADAMLATRNKERQP